MHRAHCASMWLNDLRPADDGERAMFEELLHNLIKRKDVKLHLIAWQLAADMQRLPDPVDTRLVSETDWYVSSELRRYYDFPAEPCGFRCWVCMPPRYAGLPEPDVPVDLHMDAVQDHHDLEAETELRWTTTLRFACRVSVHACRIMLVV